MTARIMRVNMRNKKIDDVAQWSEKAVKDAATWAEEAVNDVEEALKGTGKKTDEALEAKSSDDIKESSELGEAVIA